MQMILLFAIGLRLKKYLITDTPEHIRYMSLYFQRLLSLKQDLEKISPLHRVALAASCCERLLPNYYVFAREEGQGNPSIPREALDEVWQILNGKPIDTETIRQLEENKNYALIPDEEVFNSQYNYEAQLAAIAIFNTLEACLISPNLQMIMSVLEGTGDTISEFLRVEKQINDPNWLNKSAEEQDQEIDNHPFTIREIAKQREDLQRLKEIETLNREFLDWLRTSSDNGGRSLIDIS